MDFYSLAHERFSVRKFRDTPVEQEKLDLILEVANAAPTAMNIQPQRIYVVRSAECLEKMNRLSPCVYGAPVVLIVAYDKHTVFHNMYDDGINSGDQDVSIIGTHIMLEAWSLGVGSCWVNRFSPEEVRKEFDLPDNEQVVFLMPLGYPDASAEPSPRHTARKPLRDTVEER